MHKSFTNKKDVIIFKFKFILENSEKIKKTKNFMYFVVVIEAFITLALSVEIWKYAK